jgi:hypothetical protein
VYRATGRLGSDSDVEALLLVVARAPWATFTGVEEASVVDVTL